MSKTIEKAIELIDEEIHEYESFMKKIVPTEDNFHQRNQWYKSISLLNNLKQKLQPQPTDFFDRVYREEDLGSVFFKVCKEQEKAFTYTHDNLSFMQKNNLLYGNITSTKQGAERLLKALQNVAKIQAYARELNRKSNFVVDYTKDNVIKIGVSIMYSEDDGYYLSESGTYMKHHNWIHTPLNNHNDAEQLIDYILETLKLTQQELEDIMHL